MCGDEQVLRGGTAGDDLFDRRDAPMLADPRGDDDDQRRAHRLAALLDERGLGNVRLAAAQGVGENRAEHLARAAFDDDELPRTQPAVIGCTHG